MEPQGKSKLAWVQNDLFCGCGYNLFAQPVQVDERLGIPVSRCPECGKFHAMTTTFATLSTWRTRQEQALILTVTFTLLIVMALMTLGMWGLQMGYLSLDFETQHYFDRQIYYGYQLNYNSTYYQRTPNQGDQFILDWGMHLYRLVCVLGGFIYVTTAMTFFWHWKKRLYSLLAVIPALIAGVTIWGIYIDGGNWVEYRDGYGEARIIFGAIFEIVGIAIGIWVGRRTSRGLIRLFVPHKWRTPFKHLWLVDGVQMPGIVFMNPIDEKPMPLEAPVKKADALVPPESKVPEARKGLESATDVIARMMSAEKKNESQTPREDSNP